MMLFLFFVIVSLGGALALDWVVVGGAIFFFPISFFLILLLFWFWRMSELSSITLAIFAGLFLDFWSPHPAGTYLLLLPFCSFFIARAKRIAVFSDTPLSYFFLRIAASYIFFLILFFAIQKISLVMSMRGIYD